MSRMLPEINLQTAFDQDENSEEITGYLTPLFDFRAGEFVSDSNGVVKVAEGQIGMANLIEKIHLVPRNAYRVYTDAYGSDARYVLIDRELNEEAKILRLKEVIRDSLIYDKRVVDVSVIEIERQSDESDVFVASYIVYTIYGNIPVRREVLY
ncbi:DUF2634 domain-containing protein [Bacillus wiedmannii]|uniref:DUF2634 domain-containing protein n=1 Tax=Bacillus wiedmannii TaxID=1890302 RepID=UPI000BF23CA6|nr:DUF2634 domain-containing protein [Bacillus wiedmannii]PEJ95092.1 hypothetical protein CN690_28245 [Bacillus wiedmannii]PHF09314.1 hypothetical protein COF74_11010 [Bacillus wiedmannii]